MKAKRKKALKEGYRTCRRDGWWDCEVVNYPFYTVENSSESWWEFYNQQKGTLYHKESFTICRSSETKLNVKKESVT